MTEPLSRLPFVLSGQEIKTIKISAIKIGERQRTIDPDNKEWKEHVQNLAASIKRAGLIHPITLSDHDDELVTGFNRIFAFLQLGYDEIPYMRRSELSDIERKVLELEENLQRLGLPFADKVKAIAEIDALQRRISGDKGEAWTTAKTAEMVGVSVGTVSQAKKVVEAAKLDPTLLNATGLVAALKKIQVGEQLDKRRADIVRREAGIIRTYPAEILVGDAFELCRQQEAESFDAVITNFPFGIELTLGKEQKEIYHDAEDYIVKLVRAVTHECYRLLKPDSWMVGFFDIRKIGHSNKQREYVERSLATLKKWADHNETALNIVAELNHLAIESLGLTYWMEEAGFDYVQLLPCIWVKPNKTQGAIGDPNKGVIMAYEAFVLAGKGTPVLMKKGRQNIFIFDTVLGSDRDIDVQMPLSICRELVSMTCLGGSRILDPFAGSGAVGEGALTEQCSFLGFELDPARAEIGNLRLREHIHAQGGHKDSATPEGAAFDEGMQRFLAQREVMLEAEKAL